VGSYVPAKHARMGAVDQIFTRIGAADDLASGRSTFMVEMTEAAAILHRSTEHSLVLMDEIGRGTSTFDGLALAWAIAQHLLTKNRSWTLFATHYHELNEMADRFKRIKNYNVSVKELENKVLFLRKLTAGGSEHSFGIHVARMAGMPKLVLERANQILAHLESLHKQQDTTGKQKKMSLPKQDFQLSFFQLDDPVLSNIKEELLKTDINTLTPVEALMKLHEIKKLTGG
jgi:DNA mismatch repair protein MutS